MKACTLCGNSSTSLVYSQREIPVFQHKIYDSIKTAQEAAVADVNITQCNHCGFIYNGSFDNDLMVYDEDYHNEQGHSMVFKEHQSKVLDLLLEFGIKDKKIIEIGCGKGDFLELMRAKGMDCMGFDPTYEGDADYVVKEYFSDKYANLEGDVIIMRHTLEHIQHPHKFIQQIAKANNNKGWVFIEVPTFDWIVEKNAFWDIFYEHCNYFTESTLNQMFGEAVSGSIFNGQYIYVWGNLATVKDAIPKNSTSQGIKLNDFKNLIESSKQNFSNDSVAIWGAGAKGSTLLNLLDNTADKVDFIIDINPAKQHKFLAHTGHQILPPKVLLEKKINTIWIMNPNYKDEIETMISEMGINNINIKTI